MQSKTFYIPKEFMQKLVDPQFNEYRAYDSIEYLPTRYGLVIPHWKVIEYSAFEKLKEELAAEKADKQRVLDIGVKMQREVNDRVEAKNAGLIEALKKIDEWQGKQSCNASLFEITDDDFGVLQMLVHSALKKWGGV